MRKQFLLLLVPIALSLLAGCGKPMENKALANPDRDSSGKAIKQAGGDETKAGD